MACKKSIWCRLGWHNWLVLREECIGNIRDKVRRELSQRVAYVWHARSESVSDRICRDCEKLDMNIKAATELVREQELERVRLYKIASIDIPDETPPPPPPAPPRISNPNCPPRPDVEAHQPNISFVRRS